MRTTNLAGLVIAQETIEVKCIEKRVFETELSELQVPSVTSVIVLAAGYLLSKKSASTAVC